MQVPSPRKAADSSSVLVRWMGLVDANSAGYVHGGTVMKLCDEAAATAAIRHSRMRVVTAAVDRMTFLAPVHVGELLTLKSSVNAVWRTSMEVASGSTRGTRSRARSDTRTAPT